MQHIVHRMPYSRQDLYEKGLDRIEAEAVTQAMEQLNLTDGRLYVVKVEKRKPKPVENEAEQELYMFTVEIRYWLLEPLQAKVGEHVHGDSLTPDDPSLPPDQQRATRANVRFSTSAEGWLRLP